LLWILVSEFLELTSKCVLQVFVHCKDIIVECAGILRVPQVEAKMLVWGPEHSTDEQTAALAAQCNYGGADSGYLADLCNGWWYVIVI
jgi:hypothetical protein